MKKYFFLFTLASLLLLGAGCKRATPVVTPGAIQAPVVTPKAPAIENNSITAEKQAPHEYANVSSVLLAVPGFVEIHEDANGKPGNIIGKSQLFKPGVYTVTVSLNRSSKVGETLYAMLHGADDMPLQDIKGKTAVSAFTITK